MRTVIGIIIGMALILAFQKIMGDGGSTENVEKTAEENPIIVDGQLTEEAEIPEDFIEFYDKFHEDSLFQIEHITFPLAGIPAYADSLTRQMQEFRWTKDKWRMHNLPDEKNVDMDKKWVKLGDKVIVEMIQLNETKTAMQRRFVKTSMGWALTYYAAPNYGIPE